MTHIIEPHGGILCDLLIHGKQRIQIKTESIHSKGIAIDNGDISDEATTKTDQKKSK